MRRIVLIPAYKPDAAMTDLVFTLYSHGMSVVVVDDGSGKDFRPLFEKARSYADVITANENGGKGAALQMGFAYIAEHFAPPYTVVTADADGQHRPEDILAVSETAGRYPEALVLGCRTISRDMPLRNWFGNVYTKAAFILSTGRRLTDTQTGLRGFSDLSMPFMRSVKGGRYEYEMNILLWWVRGGKPVREVPIRTVYIGGNSTSHFKAIGDSVRIYWEIVKFSAPSFGCFALDVLLFSLLFFNLPLPFFTRLLCANLAASCVTAPLVAAAARLSTAVCAALRFGSRSVICA